jgi:surfeit locus 1 family protein
MPGRYRFVVTRRWIAGHLIAVLAVIGFVNLGLWQLRRLDERRAFNATVATRTAADPVPFSDLAPLDDGGAELAWKRVVLEGRYRLDEEVLLQAQSLSGVSGHDVLTPLDVGGVVVVVDRGWVPIDVAGPPVVGAEPSDVITKVEGVLRTTEVRGRFGPTDPATGTLERISRVDLARLDSQIDGPLFPMWVQLTGSQPAAGDLPRPRPLPQLDDGPHLSYAVQWFLFAGVVVVGYPLLLRRTARPAGRG